MEGSAYTERTLAIAEALHARFPGHVGTVIQAYLHRSDRDLERLIDLKMRVRLVKGAYAEPAGVALQRPAEINEAFIRLMERLLEDGRYPAIATHDPALIRATQGFALRMGIDPERWEFQMLYGVRRDAQLALAREGYGMRIYLPFGADWYPYFARRIAERPANMLFVLRQMINSVESTCRAGACHHAILVRSPDAGLPRSGVAPGALVRPGRSCWLSSSRPWRTHLVRDVSEQLGVCQKKGWFDDEPRATPALPRGRADGGAGALWVSDACPCTLRTIAWKG